MMLWPLSKRTRIALSIINAQSLGVRYARACSAEVRVERSSSMGLGMVQKLSSDPNSAPRSGKTDNRARQRLPEDKSPSVDQLASLRFAVESRGRVCLLVVESTTRRFYWRGQMDDFRTLFGFSMCESPYRKCPAGDFSVHSNARRRTSYLLHWTGLLPLVALRCGYTNSQCDPRIAHRD